MSWAGTEPSNLRNKRPPAHESPIADRLPTILPLPFGRGEGRGEGSFCDQRSGFQCGNFSGTSLPVVPLQEVQRKRGNVVSGHVSKIPGRNTADGRIPRPELAFSHRNELSRIIQRSKKTKPHWPCQN